ncbi:MAG: RHS repeat-associated core domain-containing protein [Thermoleophilia bacterium]
MGTGSVSATYTYDAQGQRTRKAVTAGTQTTTTDFTYDGLTLLRLQATQAGGVDPTSWQLTYLYDEYGKPYAGVYRSPASSTAPTVFGLVTTDRGDVVALLDAAGSPFAAYRYDAWGNPQGAGNLATGVWSQSTSLINSTLAAAITTRQSLRYAGYAYDGESNLYYLSARYYDPATRQFTSKDPAKADGEESAYQYAGGDPVGRVDPSGRDSYNSLTITWKATSRILKYTIMSFSMTSEIRFDGKKITWTNTRIRGFARYPWFYNGVLSGEGYETGGVSTDRWRKRVYATFSYILPMYGELTRKKIYIGISAFGTGAMYGSCGEV